MTQRVVVTGMAGLSPLGRDWPTVRAKLRAGTSGVSVLPQWADLSSTTCGTDPASSLSSTS